ncbi:MAG: FAD-dependent oxidoreductase, partial [Chloroflexota bacterium]
RNLQDIVNWRKNELDILNVDVHFNTAATAETIMAETPDVVIIATGGTPYFSGFSGAEHCLTIWDGMRDAAKFSGKSVILYDGIGQHPGASCAVHLAQAGAKVHFVTIDPQIALEMGGSESVMHRKRFQQHGIPVEIDLQIERVEQDGGKYKATFMHELTDTVHSFVADRIIIEQGTTPTAGLYHELREASCNSGVTDISALINNQSQPQSGSWATGYELHRIGSAVSSREIHSAVYDAFRLCHML